ATTKSASTTSTERAYACVVGRALLVALIVIWRSTAWKYRVRVRPFTRLGNWTDGRTNRVGNLSADASAVCRDHSLDASVRFTLQSICNNQTVFAENE